MIDRLLKIIAPHYCYGCGEIGIVLCDNCKYNIIDERYSGCIICRMPNLQTGICHECKTSYDRAWVVSERSDELALTLDGYKFLRQKDASEVFIDLLDGVLPDFSGMSITIIPIPTIAAHIRHRGYDHMRRVTRGVAKRRGMSHSLALRRKTNTVQLGSMKQERIAQAKGAFSVKGTLDQDGIYLLIDDVVTTGATLQFAAQALRSAGAKTVWVAAIARQPLDKDTSHLLK